MLIVQSVRDRDKPLVPTIIPNLGGGAEARRAREAEQVAAHLREIVVDSDLRDHDSTVHDRETGTLRSCAYRDVAIPFRTREPVSALERALQQYRIPYYMAGDAA